jgi:creatinine amidohydrolase
VAGKILKFEELSAPQVSHLYKEKAVVFVSISPIEGHGPHLPLGVDFYNGVYFAELIAKILIQKRPDCDALIYPGIPLGTQVYRQAGSVRIDNLTFYKLVKGLGQSLASSGFKYIFMLSGHGSPKDIVAIESAARKVRRKFKIEMYNLSGALAVRFLKGEFINKISERLPRPLTPEEKILLAKDIHGGWWETSMMLNLRPELVSDKYKDLPSIERGNENVESRAGYYGSPAFASKEFAQASLEVMAAEATRIIEGGLSGVNISKLTTSPLYKVFPLRPYFPRYFLIALIIIVLALALILYIF